MTIADRSAAAVPSPSPPPEPGPWWRDSVIYQLYLRSFADSDGDGIGDLDGVVAHLDHLVSLGVDGLWLNPCYPSSGRDGGYDISDYRTVDPVYGGLPAFERLRDAAHARGLKLLMDLVPNHCSADHPWFQQALRAAPGSPERARFHFRAGRGPAGAEPPNNWRSVFGGPAWTRVVEADGRPGQWYLHSFDPGQPDFDWSNPEVAAMFDGVLRTWFDRGIDGVRIDVAYAMIKAPGLPDVDDPTAHNPHQWNQPEVHEIFRHWRALAEGYGRDLTLVGEVWLPPGEAADYIRPGRLTQVFYFDLLQQPFEAAAFRDSITASVAGLDAVEGVPTWTLSSHDVHRAVSRFGLVEPERGGSADPNAAATRLRGRVDVPLGIARAKAALLLVLALPGSVYLYQGEEFGLPEVQDIADGARRDPIWYRSHGTEHGRDGSRIPLPWAGDAPAFGFSPAGGEPWLPQPEWFADFALDRQGDGSVLAFYRAALQRRRERQRSAPLGWLETGRPDVLAFDRGDLVSVTNFGRAPFALPAGWGPVLLRSDGAASGALSGSSSAWLEGPL